MCNYLNNYDNSNGWSLHSVYIFMKNVQKKCIPYLTGKFSKLCSNKKEVTMVSKHTLIQISLYP